jgi:hypothetical protein
MTGDDEHLPVGWPPGVRRISIDGLGDLGVKEANGELYWKGQKMVTERRFSNFERGLAVWALAITSAGVLAAIVQAWAAMAALP